MFVQELLRYIESTEVFFWSSVEGAVSSKGAEKLVEAENNAHS